MEKRNLEKRRAWQIEYRKINKDAIAKTLKIYREKNKEMLTKKRKKYRKEHIEYFNKKSNDFYHKNKDKINNLRRKNPYSLMSILKRNASKRDMEFSLTREDFSKWWFSQEQKCAYCDIPLERMKVVNRSKKLARRLSVDRTNNDKGYVMGNLVLACMSCNFIKSNVFTFDEMREIAQKYLKPKWQL